jgi:hypothetical protein
MDSYIRERLSYINSCVIDMYKLSGVLDFKHRTMNNAVRLGALIEINDRLETILSCRNDVDFGTCFIYDEAEILVLECNKCIGYLRDLDVEVSGYDVYAIEKFAEHIRKYKTYISASGLRMNFIKQGYRTIEGVKEKVVTDDN